MSINSQNFDVPAPDRAGSDEQTALLPRVVAGSDEPARVDGWLDDGAGSDRADPGAARRRLAWLLSALTMAVLGAIRTSWASLDGDELTAWRFVNLSWSQVRAALPDLSPGDVPYLLLLKALGSLLGTSDFVLRLPALLAMTVAAGALAALGARLLSPRAGFIAGMTLAAVPTASQYAQHIGPQAFVICAATLGTLLLVRLFDQPTTRRTVNYSLALLLLGLSAVGPFLLLLLAHATTVWLVRRGVRGRFLVAASLPVVPITVAYLLLDAPRLHPAWVPPVDLPQVTRLPADLAGSALLGGLLAGLALLSVSLRRPGVLFTTWALVPVATLYLVTQLEPVWGPAQLLFTLPAWVLLGAQALGRAPVFRGVIAVVTVALLGLPAQMAIRRSDGHGLAGPELARIIAAERVAGDAIVYGASAAEVRTGRTLIDRYLPAALRPADPLLLPDGDAGIGPVRECVDVAKCLDNAPRVWLVRIGHSADPLEGLPAAKDGVLRTAYTVERAWELTGLTLVRYAASAGPDKSGR
jgi:mannosyltransferase